MAAVIQVKRGSASSWTSANTVLAAGEIGFETDTKKMKVGDGSTAWTSLAYTATDGDISGVTAGTGLSGGGTSGAVTLTNSMATEITAKGDLVVGTGNAAFDNLPVGANGTVLTADSTISPTGLKWAAPSAGAMVFISGATFTGVSSVSFPNNTFTSTYDVYKIFFQFNAASSNSVVQLRMRNSGTDITSGNYFFGGLGTDYLSSTTVYKNGSANSAWSINADANIDRTVWEMTICNPQNSAFGGNGYISGMGDRMAAFSSGLWQNAVSTFDSMSIIKSTSGTFSGRYAIYALVKS